MNVYFQSEINAAVTVATVNAILSCNDVSGHDPQMVLGAARAAGLWPIHQADMSVLLREIGDHRLARFIELCEEGDGK